MLLAILYDRGIGINSHTKKSHGVFKKLSEENNANNAIAEFMLDT
ncbi:hypothetical protein [Coxiella-like endosymbiont]|nr:hypothetical protein [Coxiella-like endosymbiont]